MVGGGGRAETTGGDGEKTEGGDASGETGSGNFAEEGGAVVGSARGVPEESGGRKRGSRKLQDSGGAPVLELHKAGEKDERTEKTGEETEETMKE